MRITIRMLAELTVVSACLCAPASAADSIARGAFPAGLQAFGNAGIGFQCGAQYRGTSYVLPTVLVQATPACATRTCGAANCVASGVPSPVLALPQFQFAAGNTNLVTPGGLTLPPGATDFNTISVPNGATLNMSTRGVVRINSLTLGASSQVNWLPGDYWIGNLAESGAGVGATFSVIGTGTVRIFVRSPVTFHRLSSWNASSSAGRMVLYFYDAVTLDTPKGSNVNAIVYAAGQAALRGAALTGALAAKSVVLAPDASVAYDAAAVGAADFGPSFAAR